MSQITKLQRILYSEKQFVSALETLQKAIDEVEFNEYVRDATIQRFEYTYETTWKLLKFVFSYQGLELRYPKEIFREAFAAGWIENPESWEDMIEDRNLTSHTYKERTAQAVYDAIKENYLPAFNSLQASITEVIRNYVRDSRENQSENT